VPVVGCLSLGSPDGSARIASALHTLAPMLFLSRVLYPTALPSASRLCHGHVRLAEVREDFQTLNQKWIDGWNDTWLYVRASRSSGNLVFTWDVAFLTGVSPEYVQTAIQLFKAIVDQSTDFKP
jgi:hypothetical protein